MPRVIFAPAIQRHVAHPERQIAAATVGAALAQVFEENPDLRGYVLDDQGCLRRHLVIFVDGLRVRDRQRLGDPVRQDSEIYVVQALSGG